MLLININYEYLKMKKMIAIIWYVAKHYKDALPTNEVKKEEAENTCRVM